MLIDCESYISFDEGLYFEKWSNFDKPADQ